MNVVIRPRSYWKARAARSRTIARATGGCQLHWAGTPMGNYTEASAATKIRGIQAYHMDSNGWTDIAYNFIIDRFGNIYEGRGEDVTNGAGGVASYNRSHLAIMYLGGVGESFTKEAKSAFARLMAHLRSRGTAGPATIGHRDIKKTDCPGNEIYTWMKDGAKDPGGPIQEDEDMAVIIRATDPNGNQRNALSDGLFRKEFISVAAMNQAHAIGAPVKNVSWDYFTNQLVDIRKIETAINSGLPLALLSISNDVGSLRDALGEVGSPEEAVTLVQTAVDAIVAGLEGVVIQGNTSGTTAEDIRRLLIEILQGEG